MLSSVDLRVVFKQTTLQGNVETFKDMLATNAIDDLSKEAVFGRCSLVKGGVGFFANATQGATGGFTGGFVSGTGGAMMGGADLGEGLLMGAKVAVIGGVSGAILGGLSGGIKAENNGMNFWTGDFKTPEKALKHLNNLLASKDGYFATGELKSIDLGSENIHEEIKRVFSYLNRNGPTGYNIDELVDFDTQFDKPIWKKVADGFFDGGMGKIHNKYNITSPKSNLTGSMNIDVWTDHRLVSGTFEYMHKPNGAHYLYLDSKTGSQMIGVGFNIRKLYNYFVYDFIGMNSSNVH